MSASPVEIGPLAQNGILFVGPEWTQERETLVGERYPELRVERISGAVTRLDLSRTERGSCPGFNDQELLGLLSRTGVGVMAVGYYCDSIRGAEGARVFESGRQVESRRIDWAAAPNPDPIVWPISTLAMSLRLPIEAITQVTRPERPDLAVSVETLLLGEELEDGDRLNRALDTLGQVPLDEATVALARHLTSAQWVTRFHAARAYVRIPRGQGRGDMPRLQSLMEDEDESVREATLEGVLDLIAEVAFSDEALLEQIDAVVACGLQDDDEDVRAVAGRARDLRAELLG